MKNENFYFKKKLLKKFDFKKNNQIQTAAKFSIFFSL